MQKLFTTLILGALFAVGVQAAGDQSPLTIEMSDPKVRITIPLMNGIDMKLHPMNEKQPDFKLLGDLGQSSVSVITPAISAEVSPMSCAAAVANIILGHGVVSRDQMFLGRANEQTFLIIYGLPVGESVVLNTHIVSSAATAQCVEAHVSRVSASEAEIEPWFNGFGESNIETL